MTVWAVRLPRCAVPVWSTPAWAVKRVLFIKRVWVVQCAAEVVKCVWVARPAWAVIGVLAAQHVSAVLGDAAEEAAGPASAVAEGVAEHAAEAVVAGRLADCSEEEAGDAEAAVGMQVAGMLVVADESVADSQAVCKSECC